MSLILHLAPSKGNTVIQLKESEIPLMIGILNPSSTDPAPGIQNPRLSWIPLRWAIHPAAFE